MNQSYSVPISVLEDFYIPRLHRLSFFMKGTIGLFDNVVDNHVVYHELILIEIADDPFRLSDPKGFGYGDEDELGLLLIPDEVDDLKG